MKESRSVLHHPFARAALALFVTAPWAISFGGCTDEGEPTASTGGTGTTSAAGGSGASGGQGGSGGGAGGSGGAGGGGGGCLPAEEHSALFSIEAADLCALAIYTASGSINYQQPTWGAHGGPLLVGPGMADGQVTLERWTPPSGQSGVITIAKSTIDAAIPTDAFVGGAAVDLGFRTGTAISYSGAFPDTQGELIVLQGNDASERYTVNGLFSMAVLPAGGSGRLVASALSPIGKNNAGNNALYAADDCQMTFDPNTDPSCADPIEVVAWGDASGPVVADSQGNTFVVMTSFAGDQEGRAFAASTIGKGSPPVNGDTLFTLPGFGIGLAAIVDAGGAQGIVAFQPSDAMTFEALDVLQIRYSVNAGAIAPDGEPSALLKLATPNTALAMLADPQERLWVAVPTQEGTTFVVIGKKPE